MTVEGRLRRVPIAGCLDAGRISVNGFDNRTHIFTGSQARRRLAPPRSLAVKRHDAHFAPGEDGASESAADGAGRG